MKKVLMYGFFFILGILYLLLTHKYNIGIPCPIYLLTGLHCPGCGTTRMLYAILNLDFYQAYRYNPLMFVTLPFSATLIINGVYAHIWNKNPWYKKIPLAVWSGIIILLLLYGILRNIFPYLSPTKI